MGGQGKQAAASFAFAARGCLTLFGGALVAVGCKPAPLSIPDAPDMSALVQAYEQPSAEFDPDEIDEVRVTLGVLDTLVERTRIDDYVYDALDSVVGETESTGDEASEGGDLTLEADGYLRVKRICKGWVAPAVPDSAENGQLDLTTTFTERGLEPVIWGNALRCRYLVGEVRLELDQIPDSPYGLSVYWGEGVKIQSLAERPLLFALNLSSKLGDEQLDLQLDFRALIGRAIEHRIDRGGASFIASISEAGGVTLRAENGTFECPEGALCTRLTEEGASD